MEVKFDVVKPNLYVVGDNVYFGIDCSDVIRASRSVDEAITKHIGVLKVEKEDFEVLGLKNTRLEGNYNVPLREYLNSIEGRRITGITGLSANLFGIGYLVCACTKERGVDVDYWIKLQRDLANPNKFFDRYEKKNLVYRVDREKTLEEMIKAHKKLDPQMPENEAGFIVINGEIASSKQELELQGIGTVTFRQIKSKDKTKIEEAKTDLVERLKEFDGPCLSFDAPIIYKQALLLYMDAPALVQKYGDILLRQDWKERFFRFDP